MMWDLRKRYWWWRFPTWTQGNNCSFQWSKSMVLQFYWTWLALGAGYITFSSSSPLLLPGVKCDLARRWHQCRAPSRWCSHLAHTSAKQLVFLWCLSITHAHTERRVIRHEYYSWIASTSFHFLLFLARLIHEYLLSLVNWIQHDYNLWQCGPVASCINR